MKHYVFDSYALIAFFKKRKKLGISTGIACKNER